MNSTPDLAGAYVGSDGYQKRWVTSGAGLPRGTLGFLHVDGGRGAVAILPGDEPRAFNALRDFIDSLEGLRCPKCGRPYEGLPPYPMSPEEVQEWRGTRILCR